MFKYIAIAGACLSLTACAGLIEKSNESMGFTKVTKKYDDFNETTKLHLSRSAIRSKESGYNPEAFTAEAYWQNDIPKALTLKITIDGLIANIDGLEVKNSGEIKSYKELGTFSDWSQSRVGNSIAVASTRAFMVPIEDVKSWMASEKVMMRVFTSKGTITGYFHAQSANGDITLKNGLKKLLPAIDAEKPKGESPSTK